MLGFDRTPEADNDGLRDSANGVTNNNDYGSIAGSNDSHGEESSLLNDSRRQSVREDHHSHSWGSIIFRVVLVAGLFFVIAQQGASSGPSEQKLSPEQRNNWPNVNLLGKIHRSEGDIPYVFSQRIDHLDPENQNTYQQRYYRKAEFFKGPGHPIILVVGGEGALDEGMFYPFVDTYLARKFGAYVLHPEHRFYGQSQPLDPVLVMHKPEQLKKYHTVRQAILDHITLVKVYQNKLGCSPYKTSKHYCPVITVGGSYPGFLSALMRLHYPDTVDIGYASSAPLPLYAMESDQFGFMDKVSEVADIASPGCFDAVRQTLDEVDDAIRSSHDHVKFAYDKLGICEESLPLYINSKDMLVKEVMMVVTNNFADWNMFFYPPDDPDRDLTQVCKTIFQNETLDSFEKMKEFWLQAENNIDITLDCFDMSSQLPDGAHATISGSDWSGVGFGYDGMMFDFHCCSTLTPAVGFGKHSMFPYRKWTLEWLTDHCVKRFDVVPDPLKLVREFKFNDLVGQGATRILFTNGMNDIWSQGSYLESLSDSILAINIPNGAHHSDLSYMNSDGVDTPDMMDAHDDIEEILEGWLGDIKERMVNY